MKKQRVVEEQQIATEPTLPQLAAAVESRRGQETLAKQALDKAVSKLEVAKSDVNAARTALAQQTEARKAAAAALQDAARTVGGAP